MRLCCEGEKDILEQHTVKIPGRFSRFLQQNCSMDNRVSTSSLNQQMLNELFGVPGNGILYTGSTQNCIHHSSIRNMNGA